MLLTLQNLQYFQFHMNLYQNFKYHKLEFMLQQYYYKQDSTLDNLDLNINLLSYNNLGQYGKACYEYGL